MRSRIAILTTLLVLGTAIVATAQIAVEPSTGTIVRIDPQSNVVILDDGRMYRVTPSTVFSPLSCIRGLKENVPPRCGFMMVHPVKHRAASVTSFCV